MGRLDGISVDALMESGGTKPLDVGEAGTYSVVLTVKVEQLPGNDRERRWVLLRKSMLQYTSLVHRRVIKGHVLLGSRSNGDTITWRDSLLDTTWLYNWLDTDV